MKRESVEEITTGLREFGRKQEGENPRKSEEAAKVFNA